jgi:diguanylate cyclase (GGDEF)-like protein
VGNRRCFDKVLRNEWSCAQRSRQPLSLVLLDIDYFKQYNDHYGHIQGDNCLKRVGALLDSVASRPRDFLARYGGEEFVLVLPETDAQSACRLAERCRELIEQSRMPHEKSKAAPVLTVSLGVGAVVPDMASEPLSLIDAVDRALYQAKTQGRNRVAMAEPS